MTTRTFFGALLCALSSAIAYAAPVIDTQPAAATIVAGQSGSLTVVASGATTYQWRKLGVAITNATTASLSLPTVALTDAGYYDVQVGDGTTSVTSKAVRVDVVPPVASYPTVLRPKANAPRFEIGSGNVFAIAVDAADSNRIYVAGEFTRINSTVRLNVARFNADGTFDSTWTPAALIGGGSARALLVESDGIIVGGDFTAVAGVNRPRLVKLSKTTGAVDATFGTGTGPNGSVHVLARQTMADNSVRYLVGGSFSSYDGTTVNRLVRIDTNGVRDTSFNIGPAGTPGYNNDVRAIVVDGTGSTARLYVGGLFTSHHGVTSNRNRMVRVDANGAYDSAFNIGAGFGSDVRAIALQGTGDAAKVYVGGTFTSFNNVTTNRNRLVRVDAFGAYDTGFDMGTGFNSDVLALAVDSTGNVYVGGNFNNFNAITSNVNRILRFSSGGVRDTGFNATSGGANGQVNTILLREADGQFLLGGTFTTYNTTVRNGIVRAGTAAGAIDTTLNPDMRRPGAVFAIEPAPGGKWYVGGTFNFIDDTARSHVAVLNTDGSLDTTWNTAANLNNGVNAIAVQGDGKLVVGGFFSAVGATSRSDIARLNADGSLDSTFNPGNGFNGTVTGLTLAPDGKIVAAGTFTTFNTTNTRIRLARLNADGSIDSGFDPGAVGFTGGINAPTPLAFQSDGKLIVGGSFTAYAGTNVGGIVRISTTGAIDTSFNSSGAGFASNVDVRALSTRLSDKIVAGGSFTTYNATTRNRVSWLTDTGALDSTFSTTTGVSSTASALHVQSDDKTIVAGVFTTAVGTSRNGFARINANGTLDSSFNVPTAIVPSAFVNVIRPAADGSLVVGATRVDFGEFVGRGSFLVLEPAPVPVINTQPTSVVGTLNGNATFTVAASGESLQYQWSKNGQPITGATNASLNLTGLGLLDLGNYAVTVSNAYGTVTSSTVTLTGSGTPPVISQQPAAAFATAGGNASLTVSATGANLVYQWRKAGVPIAGATNATLSLSGVGQEATGYYDVIVGAGLSTVVSTGGYLSVAPAPVTVALQPRASFEPRVEGVANITTIVQLGDGRYYVAGGITSVDGTPRQSIVRFNSDNTVDPAFAPPPITGTITSLAVQADGKVVIGGTFVWFGNVNSFRLARLNTDGSLDAAFNIGSGFSGGQVNAIAIQPADQKIIVVGAFTGMNSTTAGHIIRLNPDATPDATFNTGSGFDGTVTSLVLQADGSVVVGGSFTNFNGAPAGRIVRLGTTGARDLTYANNGGFDASISSLALQSDGRVIVGGAFDNYGGSAVSRLARLGTDGVRDTGFAAGLNFNAGSTITALAIQGNGGVLVGGTFTTYNGGTTTVGRMIRIDGSTNAIDTAFNTSVGTGFNNTVQTIAVQSSGSILTGGIFGTLNNASRFAIARLSSAGAPDASFTVNIRQPGQVFAIQPVAGGRYLIGGSFTHVGNTAVNNLALVGANGAVDASLNIGSGPNGTVRALVTQGDGKFVLAGNFTSYNGTTAPRIARISAVGTFDGTFTPPTTLNGQINALAQCPDGTLVAAGAFTAPYNRIVRLLPNGAQDSGFNPGTGFNNTVLTLVVRPDGKIAAGGTFNSFNNGSAVALAQLMSGGGIDTSFQLGSGFNLSGTQTGTPQVNALLLEPDGKLVVGGFFGGYNFIDQFNLLRLMPNGTRDLGFGNAVGAASSVTALTRQNDGAIIAAGNFTRYLDERRGGLARITPNGRLDPTFGVPFANTTPSSTINVLQFAADGSLLAGSSGRMDFASRVTGGLMLFEPVSSMPFILTKPFGGTFIAGSTENSLSVTAATSPTATYQWKRNNVDIPGSNFAMAGTTTNVLSFNNAQAGDAGSYTVTITDGANSVTSDPVTVTIAGSKPVITDGPFGTYGVVMQANSASYVAVDAIGSAPITAQWQKNGTNVTGGFYNEGSFYLPFPSLKPSDAGVYTVALSNTLGSAPSGATRLYVTEESGWQWNSPLPSGNGLTSLVFVNGKFVAGGLRGTRISSTDGISWAQLPALSENNVIAIVPGANGRQLIAGSLGFTAVSNDGITWQTGNTGAFEPTQGAAFGAGVFVISAGSTGSSSNSGKIFSSVDGITWIERASRTTGGFNGTVFGNGVFATLTGGRTLMRSTSGTSWTEVTPPFPITAVNFTNGLFVGSTNDGQIFSSPDALSWTARGILNVRLDGIGFGNGLYVGTGAGGVLATSSDLVTWTPRASGTGVALRNVVFANNMFVVTANQSVPNVILTSPDGVTWTNRMSGVTGSRLEGGATDGTTLIVAGDAGLTLRTTDGVNWTPVSTGVSDNLKGVAYANGKFVVVGNGSRIFTSTDSGATWTAATSPTTKDLWTVLYANGQFIATGDQGALIRSTDGSSWSNIVLSGTPQIEGVAFGAGVFVATAGNGTAYSSPDGVTWTPSTVPTTSGLGGVAFNGTTFLTASPTGESFTSTNGISWTARGTIAGMSDAYPGAVAGRFIIGAGNSAYLSSIDGLTWAGHKLGTAASINGVAEFKGRLYAFGDFGVILSTPVAPTILQQPANESAIAGLPARLSVLAGDSPQGVAYQWRKNGTAIDGATNATFVLPSFATGDAGSYDVVLTNSANSVTSAPVALSQIQPPTIIAQPATTAPVAPGGSLTLFVSVSGTFPMNFQWRKDGANIAGATASAFIKPSFTAADTGNYDVVVSNPAGTVTSTAASATLVPNLGAFMSDQAYARPDFKQAAMAGRIAVDSAGKVYATWTNGSFISGVGNQQRGVVLRLNADGSADANFTIGAALVDAWALAIQSDGKLLVGGTASNETDETGLPLPRVYRFNTDGSRDFTFFSPVFAGMPRFMTIQPDGKVLVVVSSTITANGGIPIMARLNTNGSMDATFTQPTLSAGGSIFSPPVVASDGKIYVGGIFSTINGVNRPALARLNVNGSVDTSFTPSGFTVVDGITQVRGLALQTQGANAGKLLVAGGSFNVPGSAAPGANRPVIRLLSSGAIDTAFTLVTQADAGMSPRPRLLNILADDRFYVVGGTVARFLPDGVVDSSYTRPTFSAEFFWMDTMADGRVVVTPEFGSSINGAAATSLVRLTATGAVDTGFTPPPFNREIYPAHFALVADNKLLTWGPFDRASGVARPGIARFNTNGTLDTAFNVSGVSNLVYVSSADVAADGKIVASTRVGPNLVPGLVRLNPDGAVDSGFTADASLANVLEFDIRLLPQNKIAVWSVTPQGVVNGSNFLRRLTATGANDATFTLSGLDDGVGAVYRGANGAISSITYGGFRVLAHDALGRLIARITTGSYPAGATSMPYTLVRINTDGSKDTTFVAPSLDWSAGVSFTTITDPQTNGGAFTQVPMNGVFGAPFTGVLPLADGKLLVYGVFSSLSGSPAHGMARLTANGAVDTGFNIGTGPELRYQGNRTPGISGLAIAPDGKLWVTGAFDIFNGVAAPGIVRLNGDGTVDLNFATDIFYRQYLGAGTQVSFGTNATVYMGGTFMRPGDAFPSAFQALNSIAPAAPILTTPPVATTANAGNAVTLSVAASGAGTLTYQWFKNDVLITGATTNSLTFAHVSTGDAGSYKVAISGAGGTTTSTAVSLVVVNGPAITVDPQGQTLAQGATLTLNVTASGTSPLSYQWKKGGNPIANATNASFSIAAVAVADAGTYTVTVSNTAGSTTSAPAVISVIPTGTAATQAVVGAGYVADSTVTVAVTMNFNQASTTALGFQVVLPTGWSFVSQTATAVATKPQTGQTAMIEWSWSEIPSSPITFNYTLAVPAGETGAKQIAALMLVRTTAQQVLQLLATPDPLVVNPATTHSADSDRNFRISLFELTRVIELYNTRRGTERTGAYQVQSGTEDGFAPDPARDPANAVTLTRYHSADTTVAGPIDGRIGLVELTRVIALYNYRAGTVRTGEYHVQAETEDGYAPGP